MKRFLSASALGIVLSIVIAASIQAYDEPKLPCEAAKSSACGKKSAECLILGGVTPRIIIQEEEETLLGIAPDTSSPCCKEFSDCPVLRAAQTAKSAVKPSLKIPRAFAIKLDLDFGEKSSSATGKSECNCCEGSASGACADDACASKCTGYGTKCCAEEAGATGCCAEKEQHSSCEANENLAQHRKVRDGEAAKVLLEVLDQLGPSVLEGTVFDCDSCPLGDVMEPCVKQRSIRQQLVEYVHKLEADDVCASQECSESCERSRTVGIPCGVDALAPCQGYSPYPVPFPGPYAVMPPPCAAPPTAPYFATPYVAAPVTCESVKHEASISALRDAAETLERTASQLERHNLYDSSDLTREMAGHLRLESRRLQREASEPAEGASQVETTTHHEAAVPPKQPEANQAWYFGGIRVQR